MFWNFHYNSSGIDNLLSKEDVKLLEILDVDEVLQECKSQNGKLIDFFVKDEILKELLHLVVDQPSEDLEEESKYKYKNLACEIITSDVHLILEKICSTEEYFDIIWSLVKSPSPLNPLLASFFSKVISTLIQQKGRETFKYLKTHDAVNHFIVHINTSAIMELFTKMVTIVETQELRTEIANWFNEEDLIGKLIDILHPSQSEEKHYNVSQLLSELIRIGRDTISQIAGTEDPLLITLEKKETIEKLLDTMFADINQPNSTSSVLSGITTLSSMLEIKRPFIEGMEELITPADIEKIAQGVHATLDVLSSRMQSFHDALLHFKPSRQMETTCGLLDPPLGKVRLSIAILISTAVSMNTKIINESIAKTGILKVLLDLFEQYEWNNFLHMEVQNCVLAILNNETDVPEDGNVEANTEITEDALLKSLFKECNIVERCLSLWESNETTEKNSQVRKGYMGHLTRIMNEIVNAKDKGPNHETIKSIFNELSEDTREKWNELATNSLATTNERNVCISSNFSSDLESEDDMKYHYTPDEAFRNAILQQGFENFQSMTNEFIETFGFDENHVNEGEHVKNPFDEVGNIDFSINANEESENEKLFENICEQKIRPFNESDEEDEDDVWEEKHLTFSSPSSEPRTSNSVIRSDSDSSDEDKSPPRFGDDNSTNEKEERMEVDNEQDKNWWSADFSNMDVQVSNDDSGWPGAQTSTDNQSSTSNKGFADFTDISKFEISKDEEQESSNTPVAMETEGSPKPQNPSPYEVMEADTTENEKRYEKSDGENKENSTQNTPTEKHTTSITLKSVKIPSKEADNLPSNDTPQRMEEEQKQQPSQPVQQTQLQKQSPTTITTTTTTITTTTTKTTTNTSPTPTTNNLIETKEMKSEETVSNISENPTKDVDKKNTTKKPSEAQNIINGPSIEPSKATT